MSLLNAHLGRTLLASGAVALVVASCGSDNSDDGSGAAAGSGSGSFVSVASVEGTDVLVDAKGETLYSTEAEKGGKIHCVDACTSFWEPLMASNSDVNAASKQLRDELGVVDRPDGESQLTYDGLPLYTFVEEGAGELKGDGFTDDFQGTHFEWSAAQTDEAAGQSGTNMPDDSDGGGYDSGDSGGGGYGY
jgi:predicted lipoprotein with Yx(FWY)xxD motif